MLLKPKSFEFKTEEFALLNLSTGKHYGILAQDIQKVFPDMVADASTRPIKNSKTGKLSKAVDLLAVDYDELIPIAIAAIQEQQQQIDDLKKIIEELRKK